MRNLENISDSEIRVIGGDPQPPKKHFWWLLFAIIIGIIALVGFIVWWQWPSQPSAPEQPVEPTVFEQEEPVVQPHPLSEWLTSLDSITTVGTVTTDITINDIPLCIYAPLNSIPHLEVGYCILDSPDSAILFFQAADVRADNREIVGSFVQHGEPLSRGHSKKGYCAVIDGHVTVGVADNSPLFEKATETNGDFFRQYPLVDNGMLVESNLKNKSIRRALCDIDNHIVVVETQTKESMHDFAQALVDIGVSNAIYLVGSHAVGWSMDADGNGTKRGLWDPREIKNVNFIIWSK